MSGLSLTLRTQPADRQQGDLIEVDGNPIPQSAVSEQREVVSRLARVALDGRKSRRVPGLTCTPDEVLGSIPARTDDPTFAPTISISLRQDPSLPYRSHRELAGAVVAFAQSVGFSVDAVLVESQIRAMARSFVIPRWSLRSLL